MYRAISGHIVSALIRSKRGTEYEIATCETKCREQIQSQQSTILRHCPLSVIRYTWSGTQHVNATSTCTYMYVRVHEQIDKEAFLYMPESMIKELIPIIGKRFCFLQNRKQLLESEDKSSYLEYSQSDKFDISESKDTCSVASRSSINSFQDHGKILRDLLSKSGCSKKILEQTRLTPSDRIKANEDENIENTDYQKVLLKLRAIQPDDPNLENLWKETYKARNRETSINAYYEEYPILKTSFGAILLQIDFKIETEIDAHIFPNKWSQIASYILDLAIKKEACPSLCELHNDIPSETLSLFVLPHLFSPCNVKTGNKKKWKPSKTEIAESFICRIPNIAELEPKLEKRKEKLEALGLPLQPMVVVIGSIINLTSFYVVVNNVKYESTSLINAVNLCFQIFFALDAKYPVDSEML
ncbi:uncharacterized protein [Anoplolepis gracilipes]|uniref:uncharacterized protein n=1 Tax=Anoplolepis gracilipes TaxID=354296 RepID=UPI003B9F96DB